jgi:hypothetical protein
VGVLATVASADIVVSLISSRDAGLQSRTQQYGTSSVLVDSSNGASAIFFALGQKGLTGTANVFSNNQHDSLARALLGFNLTGQPAATGDGTITLTLYATNLSTNLTGAYIQLYKIASGNGDWQEAYASWWHKDNRTAAPVEWVGSGGVPSVIVSGDRAYPTNGIGYGTWTYEGGGGMGMGGGGGGGGAVGYDSSPTAQVLWESQSSTTYHTKGQQLVFTIPQALINDWISNPSGNTGLLVRVDPTTESLNATPGGNFVNMGFVSKEDPGTVIEFVGLVNQGKPTLAYPIPEPAAISLLALGSLILLRRRS